MEDIGRTTPRVRVKEFVMVAGGLGEKLIGREAAIGTGGSVVHVNRMRKSQWPKVHGGCIGPMQHCMEKRCASAFGDSPDSTFSGAIGMVCADTRELDNLTSLLQLEEKFLRGEDAIVTTIGLNHDSL